MMKKIIGLFICTLLLASVIPIVTSEDRGTLIKITSEVYPSRLDENWIELQKLLASDGESGDGFGCFISLSGDMALIGAFWDDDNGYESGSAYIFTCVEGTWTQQAKLLPSDGAAGDNFGSFVSLQGDTALIGAMYDESGSAYIFVRSGTTWTQQAKLLPSDGENGDMFGRCVSIDGDTAVVGAPNNAGTGAAYVFTRTGTTWTQQAKLLASDGEVGDWFGHCAVDGDTALIGAFYDDDNGYDSGSAYIFTRSGSTWTQQAKLHPSAGGTGDYFGWSVYLNQDDAIIGAGEIGHDHGSAYVYTRYGTTWIEQAKLVPIDGGIGDHFGVTVSLSEERALIGAPYNFGTGAAYVFTRSGTTWTQEAKLLASDGSGGDLFGYSVSLDNETALVNGPLNDGMGSAYIFQYSNQTQNLPPYVPNNPFPWNGMTGVDVNAMISWVGGDPNPDDIVTYDVYFGTSSSPPLITSNQSSTSYDVGMMQYSTTYYWKIVAWDNNGAKTNGPLWQFTTNLEQNQPPYTMNMSGPSIGKKGVEYRFSAVVVDPDNDVAQCLWDWGDGTTSDWQGPYDNGSTIYASHMWTTEGTYEIKLQPKDQHGLEGEWSTPIAITINISLTTTFVLGKYNNLTTEGDYISIHAVDLRMFTFSPFQYLHQIAGEKVIFSKDTMKAAIFPRFIIGIVYILF